MANLANHKRRFTALLAAPEAAFSQVKPGGSLSKANELASTVLTQGLIDLGILTGELDELMANQACKAFTCMVLVIG